MKLVIERFMDKVHIEPNGCWRWGGSLSRKGYGFFHNGKKIVRAHRWSVEHFRRLKIPAGLECDHLCKNRWCVSPNHIDIVTHSVNLQRGRNLWRERSHCKHGHPLSGDNIMKRKRGASTSNACRQCTKSKRKQHDKKYRDRIKNESVGGSNHE